MEETHEIAQGKNKVNNFLENNTGKYLTLEEGAAAAAAAAGAEAGGAEAGGAEAGVEETEERRRRRRVSFPASQLVINQNYSRQIGTHNYYYY